MHRKPCGEQVHEGRPGRPSSAPATANDAVEGQFDDCPQQQQLSTGTDTSTCAEIGGRPATPIGGQPPGPSSGRPPRLPGLGRGRGIYAAEAQGTGQGLPTSDIDGIIVATPAAPKPRPKPGLRAMPLIDVQRMLEQLMYGPQFIVGHPPPAPSPRPVDRANLSQDDLRHRIHHIHTGRVASSGGMSRMDPCEQPPGPDGNGEADADEEEPSQPSQKRVRFM